MPSNFFAYDMSNFGTSGGVPGAAFQPGVPSPIPALWNGNGAIELLPFDRPINQGQGRSTLADGTVLGRIRYFDDDFNTPTVWTPDRAVVSLPSPSTYGIANYGVGEFIVGEVHIPRTVGTGAEEYIGIWRNRQLVNIIDGFPNRGGNIFDMNASGEYVGVFSGEPNGGFRGTVGDNPTFELLNYDGFPRPTASSINDAGTIGGTYTPAGSQDFLGYVARGDDVTSYPPLPGFTRCGVQAINNDETAIGISIDSQGREAAMIYFNGSNVPVDLNTLVDPGLGLRLVRGIDIDNAGRVLVEGDSPEGFRYYILTPVPEASFGCAAMVCGMLVRRSRLRSM